MAWRPSFQSVPLTSLKHSESFLVPRRSDVHCLGPRAPQVLDGSPKERLCSYEVGRDPSQCAEPQDLAQVRDEGNFFERPDVRCARVCHDVHRSGGGVLLLADLTLLGQSCTLLGHSCTAGQRPARFSFLENSREFFLIFTSRSRSRAVSISLSVLEKE